MDKNINNLNLILFLRRPDCAVTAQIKAYMSDAMWQIVRIEYIDSDPFLRTSEKDIFDPKQIVMYLQSFTSPSLSTQLNTARQAATEALKQVVETGTALAPIQLAQFRRTICMQCPFGVKKMFIYKCSQCGCHIKTKTALFTESCPLGKW